MASPLIFGLFTTTDLLIGTAAVGALLIAFRPASATKEPTSTPTQTLPNNNKSGIYFPMYGGASQLAPLLTQIDAHPSLPFIVTINPNSGPGDEYLPVDSAEISATQGWINQLRQRPNVIVIGYIPSWYGMAVDSPPQGNQWSCSGCCLTCGHCNVIMSMNSTDVQNIKTNGVMATHKSEFNSCYSTALNLTKRALYLPALIDKYQNDYNGLQGLMIDEFMDPWNGAINTNAKIAFYKGMMSHARNNGLPYIVVNPGNPPHSWVWGSLPSQGGPDNVSVFEGNDYNNALSAATTAFNNSGGRKERVKVLLHGQASLPSQSQILALAAKAKYIFIKENAAWHQGVPGYFAQLCNILDSGQ